jgi:serine/threonine protein kinase
MQVDTVTQLSSTPRGKCKFSENSASHSSSEKTSLTVEGQQGASSLSVNTIDLSSDSRDERIGTSTSEPTLSTRSSLGSERKTSLRLSDSILSISSPPTNSLNELQQTPHSSQEVTPLCTPPTSTPPTQKLCPPSPTPHKSISRSPYFKYTAEIANNSSNLRRVLQFSNGNNDVADDNVMSNGVKSPEIEMKDFCGTDNKRTTNCELNERAPASSLSTTVHNVSSPSPRSSRSHQQQQQKVLTSDDRFDSDTDDDILTQKFKSKEENFTVEKNEVVANDTTAITRPMVTLNDVPLCLSPLQQKSSNLFKKDTVKTNSTSTVSQMPSMTPLKVITTNINPFSPEKHSASTSRKLKVPNHIGGLPRYVTDFEPIEILGSGSYGSVTKCLNRIDGWQYAIKKIKYKSLKEKERYLLEVFALAALGYHKNLLRYYGAWIEEEDQTIYLQTEYCAGGSLQSLFKEGKRFTEEELLAILRQIGSALKYLHKRKLAHLDVKPANIFIVSSDSDLLKDSKNKRKKPIYKLGDFGLINHILESTGKFSELSEGDNKYLPSEVLQFEENPSADKRLLLPKADIFSLGCSVYELASGTCLPQSGREYRKIRKAVVSLPEDSYSPQFVELLKTMLDPDPQRRPSAKELLLHPLLVAHQQIHMKAKLTKMKQKIIELKRKLNEIENVNAPILSPDPNTAATNLTLTTNPTMKKSFLLQRRVSAPNIFQFRANQLKEFHRHNGSPNRAVDPTSIITRDKTLSQEEQLFESPKRSVKRHCGDHSTIQLSSLANNIIASTHSDQNNRDNIDSLSSGHQSNHLSQSHQNVGNVRDQTLNTKEQNLSAQKHNDQIYFTPTKESLS